MHVWVYKPNPDFPVREPGHLPFDDSERHSAAMSGRGRGKDKKRGGECREEVHERMALLAWKLELIGLSVSD